MRRSAMCVVTLTALLLASCAPVSQDRRYLGGKTFGPYVGQVVDAETRAPIEGAVVVASWWRGRAWPGGRISEGHPARGGGQGRRGGPAPRPSRFSSPVPPPSRPWQSGSPRGHS